MNTCRCRKHATDPYCPQHGPTIPVVVKRDWSRFTNAPLVYPNPAHSLTRWERVKEAFYALALRLLGRLP